MRYVAEYLPESAIMDRRIKIRHLQTFTEIVRQRSLKGAARRLLLTQPAISRTLSELEEILGAELLTRGRGGIALTPEGEFFLPHAQTSLAALEQGLAGIAQAGGAGVAQMRLGALPSHLGASSFSPRLIPSSPPRELIRIAALCRGCGGSISFPNRQWLQP